MMLALIEEISLGLILNGLCMKKKKNHFNSVDRLHRPYGQQ